MKTRQLVIYGLSAIALAAILYFAPANYVQREQSLPESVPRPAASIEVAVESNAAVRFLTGDPNIVDGWASFSPDGKLILFSRSVDYGHHWDLYVVPTSGGAVRRLTDSPLPVLATRAVWSKRNDLIAFTGTNENGKGSVWLINSDGTNLRELALEGLSDRVFYPSWYPDGDHLAVVDAEDHVLKRIDLKRGIVTNLTNVDDVLAGKPSVSPDGEWIAFAGQRNGGQRYNQGLNSIWLVDKAGELHPLEPDSAPGRRPNWSPDGERLAFDSNRGSYPRLTAAFAANRDGTGLRQITEYALNASTPVWSPDGTQLVVLAQYKPGPGPFGIAIVNLEK